MGIEVAAPSIASTLAALVFFFIEKYKKKAPTLGELQAILTLRYIDGSKSIEEVVDEDMLVDLLEKEDQQTVKDWFLCSY